MRGYLATSDWHSGNRLGLLNPDTKLPSPITGKFTERVVPNEIQIWTWDLFLQLIGKVARYDELVAFIVGDVCHGNKYPEQLINDRLADQPLIAVSNFAPILALANLKAIWLVSGTGSHEFGQASSSLLVREMLKEKRPDVRVEVRYHIAGKVKGKKKTKFTVDIAHHGAYPGSRTWLKGNSVRFYLRDLMIRQALKGNTPPEFVIRGHYHEYINEVLRLGIYKSRIINLPSLMGLNDYARQRTQSIDTAQAGGIYFTNPWDVEEVIDSIDTRTWEKL